MLLFLQQINKMLSWLWKSLTGWYQHLKSSFSSLNTVEDEHVEAQSSGDLLSFWTARQQKFQSQLDGLSFFQYWFTSNAPVLNARIDNAKMVIKGLNANQAIVVSGIIQQLEEDGRHEAALKLKGYRSTLQQQGVEVTVSTLLSHILEIHGNTAVSPLASTYCPTGDDSIISQKENITSIVNAALDKDSDAKRICQALIEKAPLDIHIIR
jgi:hypothetical protein